MRGLRGFSVVAGVAVLLVAGEASALDMSGKQTRGAPGRDAKREGKAVTLKKAMKVQGCSGERMDGFWLENDQGKVIRHDSCAAAQGSNVPAGTWRVVPNLRKNADTAAVTLKLN